jgi:hypothetical protein
MSDTDDISKAIVMRYHLARKRMERLPVNWCPDDDPPGERPTSMQEVTDLTPFIESMQEWLAKHDEKVRTQAWREGYWTGVQGVYEGDEAVDDEDLRIPPPNAQCTCPSGDGSLRWPCPQHPPT